MPQKVLEKARNNDNTSGIPCFDLKLFKEEEFFEDSDLYEDEHWLILEDKKEIAKRTIQCIHSIPTLFKDIVDLGNLAIYFGISSKRSYFENMRKNISKKGSFSIIVCELDESLDYKECEKLGIEFLLFLEKNNKLCVSGLKNTDSRGTAPSEDEEAILYICFEVDLNQESDSEEIDRDELDDLAGELLGDFNHNKLNNDKDFKLNDIKQSLKLTQKESKIKLAWYGESKYLRESD